MNCYYNDNVINIFDINANIINMITNDITGIKTIT